MESDNEDGDYDQIVNFLGERINIFDHAAIRDNKKAIIDLVGPEYEDFQKLKKMINDMCLSSTDNKIDDEQMVKFLAKLGGVLLRQFVLWEEMVKNTYHGYPERLFHLTFTSLECGWSDTMKWLLDNVMPLYDFEGITQMCCGPDRNLLNLVLESQSHQMLKLLTEHKFIKSLDFKVVISNRLDTTCDLMFLTLLAAEYDLWDFSANYRVGSEGCLIIDFRYQGEELYHNIFDIALMLKLNRTLYLMEWPDHIDENQIYSYTRRFGEEKSYITIRLQKESIALIKSLPVALESKIMIASDLKGVVAKSRSLQSLILRA